jgi:hypothetical protein
MLRSLVVLTVLVGVGALAAMAAAAPVDTVTVLWPRIIPSAEAAAARDVAARVQARAREAVAGVIGGRPIDVRPEGERVCPQGGCPGTNLGVLLLKSGGGCAAVALVGRPGRTPARLVPWAGQVELKGSEVPFRQPPEGLVRVVDMLPCDGIVDAMAKRMPEVQAALREIDATRGQP